METRRHFVRSRIGIIDAVSHADPTPRVGTGRAMEFTREFISLALAGFERRCKIVRALGGIPLVDVVNGDVTVPEGWKLDQATEYFVPGNVEIPF